MQNVKEYYDEFPYFSAAFADCSPLRLQSVAEFLGLDAPKANTARVLELGCAYGGNILPFAVHNSQADIVGIDISSTQVKVGNEIAKGMGLENFKLIEKDILSIDKDKLKELGKFDYIIAHGLYSWVCDEVKEAILRLIHELLSQNGIAYISYNVYPGWKSFDILRDYMIFVSSTQKDQTSRLEKAKKELKFLSDYLRINLQAQNDPTLRDSTQLLLTQANFLQNIIKKGHDYYVLHDFLETSNDPMYFYKFAASLKKSGLCYLIDAGLDDIFRNSLGIYRFDAHISQNYPSRIEGEQMRDFMLNRSFRKSLVMKSEILGGKSDFDMDIGVNEFSKLNFILHSRDDKSGNAVYEALKNAYPQSLNLSELSNMLEQDLQSTYSQLIEIFATQNVSIAPKKFHHVKYKKGKIRIKPCVARYLEYFINEPSPVILLANELNLKVELTPSEAKAALKFDGQNSLEEIKTSLALKNADEFLNKLSNKLSEAYFLENFN
ncbi:MULTISPECIES: class I SAM-dependent methyltransferase [unclassified Campylobacter]|uniref:class I SAM-dependent methyltransferase n=1 Tax=unclassified Campylobacter TaxID=2593542 RepID=UPI0014756005|nr:class I SAM-dependent methyltransferase [Campylobacter sp. RM9328]MBE3022635.1 methyltransferase regulatory domain-containing protein [Campylobacter sp. 7477a]